MSIQISPSIEAIPAWVEQVQRANQLIEPLLREHSQTASGYWDHRRDASGRDLLCLAISDPWGYASAEFAPAELGSEGQIRRRVYDALGQMLNPSPSGSQRDRIEIRDTFITTEQLEQFRMHLGALADLQHAGLQLHNQVRFVPSRPDQFLVTDFAVEVNRDRAEEVRRLIQHSGFSLREDAPLLNQTYVRDAVKKLVDQHRGEGQAIPRLAVCFRLYDRENVHLLEVADDVEELEDGSIEGVGFNPGRSIPEARSLVIYLTHPNDLRRAYQSQPDHIFFRDLSNRQCDFIYPDDGGQAFKAAFPEMFEVQRAVAGS